MNELIDDIFVNRIEHSQTFSCYILLPCDRGPWPACLDWSEICDGKVDCLNGGIDENDCWQIEIHQCEFDEYRCMNGQCISQSFLRDNTDVFDCADKTDGLLLTQGGSAYACNRKPALVNCDDLIIEIDGKNETDETECDNVYTYCNNEWNCPNGRDELGCQLAPSISCSSNDRICVSPQTNQFMCLSMTKINDEKIDCLGGTDELKPCFVRPPVFDHEPNFYCIYRDELCNGNADCDNEDDEKFCQTNLTTPSHGICSIMFIGRPSDVENFFCKHPHLRHAIPFLNVQQLIEYDISETTNEQSSNLFIPHSIFQQWNSHYHRGVDLRVSSNKSIKKLSLCPPSFYGNHCQYQNQRIARFLANIVCYYYLINRS